MKNHKIFVFFLAILNLLIFFMNDSLALNAKIAAKHETIYLAGGCFWGVEKLYQELYGVEETQVGYMGGNIKDPTYKIVSMGLSGHAETVKIVFNNSKISIEKILKFFFSIHDPTQLNRQQNDLGTQYRSVIFYTSDEQGKIAKNVIKQAQDLKIYSNAIVTKVEPATIFYAAEDYHQDYLQKNPDGYTCHFQRREWIF